MRPLSTGPGPSIGSTVGTPGASASKPEPMENYELMRTEREPLVVQNAEGDDDENTAPKKDCLAYLYT